MDVKTGWLYTLSCDGDLRCWEAYNRTEPRELKELSRMDGILKRTDYEQGYPHVAFSDSTIVCRNMEGDLVCLSARKDYLQTARERRAGRVSP